jgi:hypothetical protein
MLPLKCQIKFLNMVVRFTKNKSKNYHENKNYLTNLKNYQKVQMVNLNQANGGIF